MWYSSIITSPRTPLPFQNYRHTHKHKYQDFSAPESLYTQRNLNHNVCRVAEKFRRRRDLPTKLSHSHQAAQSEKEYHSVFSNPVLSSFLNIIHHCTYTTWQDSSDIWIKFPNLFVLYLIDCIFIKTSHLIFIIR